MAPEAAGLAREPPHSMAEMTSASPEPLALVGESLRELGAELTALRLIDLHPAPSPFTTGFRTRFPERTEPAFPTALAAWERVAQLAGEGGVVFVAGPAQSVVVEGFPLFRRLVARHRPTVKLVTTDGGWTGSDPPVLEDLALIQGAPGVTVVVPGDHSTAQSGLKAVGRMEGPAYVRLAPDLPAPLAPAPFELGRARELREGRDLTIAAVGPPIALAWRTAEELGRVGLSARVLDCASLAPFDEKAILRAARDTGALLTIEDHQAATGLGARVATLTAENFPVPVRRLGSPDLFGLSTGPEAGRAELGLTVESALEEAWELLRLKGKVQ